jgi:hypothetical protein
VLCSVLFLCLCHFACVDVFQKGVLVVNSLLYRQCLIQHLSFLVFFLIRILYSEPSTVWHIFLHNFTPGEGRAVAQAVSRWLPTAAARVRVRAGMWGLWWTKRHWGRFSPSTSVSPASHHSTNFSIIIITLGGHNRPIGGRSAEWTQFGLHPPLYQLKKLHRGKVVHVLPGLFRHK